MEPAEHKLKDGRGLIIRKVQVEDAPAVLEYVHAICAETDFLSFGPGEFGITLLEEQEHIRKNLEEDNRLFIAGSIDGTIVAMLTFTGGKRPRLRHSGGFGLSVRQKYWGLGIGSLMLDTLIQWAGESQIIKKINLTVRTDNLRAIQLYERYGFIREGTLHKEIIIDREYYDLHWMGLEL